MNRRWICASLAGTLLWHGLGRAQQGRRNARIAVLGGSAGLADPNVRRDVDPLPKGLRERGWVEARNLVIDWRFAQGQPERLPALLAELLALQPDVLVTYGPRPAMVAKDATRSIPIVAVAVDDPVQMGLAASYSRPRGNITGSSGAYHGILSRRLQLLKDFLPNARRFAVLMNPYTLQRPVLEEGLIEVRGKLGAQIVVLEARDPDEFDAAFESMASQRVEAVVVLADSTFYVQRLRLGELVRKHRLPSVWGGRGYLEGGGLASFQGDFAELFGRAASMVDKILNGTKPGDIPWEQSTKFELVLNLKAARELGLKVPQSVLLSADEVIE
jgi:putative tryptophan/tyrosine transport system substrate-binding protein